MTDRQTLYTGLGHAAWGYLFLCFDFNVNNVSVLPRFAGWLLFLSAIEKLKEERRDLALLRPLGVLLALWTGADWLASWAGKDVDGHLLPLDLIVAVAQLYFLFQFLTDLAALARTWCREPEAADLSRRILRCRTVQTVLVTVLALAPYVPAPRWLPEGVSGGALVVLAIVYCLLGIALMLYLFRLRGAFKDAAPPPLPPASGGGTGEI